MTLYALIEQLNRIAKEADNLDVPVCIRLQRLKYQSSDLVIEKVKLDTDEEGDVFALIVSE